MNAYETELTEALKGLIPWMAKALADGAFKRCVAPHGGRAAYEKALHVLAKNAP